MKASKPTKATKQSKTQQSIPASPIKPTLLIDPDLNTIISLQRDISLTKGTKQSKPLTSDPNTKSLLSLVPKYTKKGLDTTFRGLITSVSDGIAKIKGLD